MMLTVELVLQGAALLAETLPLLRFIQAVAHQADKQAPPTQALEPAAAPAVTQQGMAQGSATAATGDTAAAAQIAEEAAASAAAQAASGGDAAAGDILSCAGDDACQTLLVSLLQLCLELSRAVVLYACVGLVLL